MSRARPHEWQVAILTHECTEIPFEETTVNLLTQFFWSLGVRLHTSILVDALQEIVEKTRDRHGHRLALVDRGRYKKEEVDCTAQFKGQNSEVVIALCHGMKSNSLGPSRLCFCCTGSRHNRKHMVYAKQDKTKIPEDLVTLDSVIGDCKLAILLACKGDDLLQEYIIEHEYGPHPDLLMCPVTAGILESTVEIYMVLLINILDSEIDVRGSGYYGDGFGHIPLLENVVYTKVRAAIQKIFQIVKLFRRDHTGFWSYLKHVGCVIDNADEKDRQEMSYPRERLGPGSRFRVYGRVCSHDTAEIERDTLEDFKNIQLIHYVAGTSRETRMDYSSVTDITWPAGQDDKIDRFLKRYQQSETRPVRKEPDPMGLTSLLMQLQNIDSVSSRASFELGE